MNFHKVFNVIKPLKKYIKNIAGPMVARSLVSTFGHTVWARRSGGVGLWSGTVCECHSGGDKISLCFWQIQLCDACGRTRIHTHTHKHISAHKHINRTQMVATCAVKTLLYHPPESLLVTYGL